MSMDIERSKLPSAANILLLIGLVALIGSFFVPSITARRVARIEGRGLKISRSLLDVALQMEPIDLSDTEQAQSLVAKLREACADLGIPRSNLPALAEDVEDPESDRIYLISKHYRFLLSREPHPADAPQQLIFVEERRRLEVYAWPRNEFASASSAFYCPEEGLPAYSRNMIARYRGIERMPSPGSARPASGTVALAGDRRGYRGQGNDERWLALSLN